MKDEAEEAFRLDKWLWAARFFKTRALAAEAIAGGKVEVNGDRAKRSRRLQPGDQVRVQLGPYQHLVTVTGLSNRRGPASSATSLYQETDASRKAREMLSVEMKAAHTAFQYDKGKPNKKERRTILRFRDKE
ncbi:MAG: S4 domain-containing protein [Gemmatimonadota bacterium]